MIFFLRWYAQWHQIQNEMICQNCEYLKNQIEIERQFNKVLFDKLTLVKTETTPVPETVGPATPRFIPWRIRKQMLEAEDKVAAQKMRDKQEELARHVPTVTTNGIDNVQVAPDDDPDVIALEKEMDLAATNRGDSGGVKFNAS